MRAWAAAGASCAAVTRTGSMRTGSATGPSWKPTSDARINGPAALVSSSAPARPGTTTGCPPRSRTEASLWETSTSRASRSSSYTSAAWNTRGCSLTSLPKRRRARRLKPRSGPEPLPASCASAIAASQSGFTPSSAGLILKAWPAAVNVTGCGSTEEKRRSSSARACAGLIPPTSTPATVTPAAIRPVEPAKAKPTTSAATASTATTSSPLASRKRLRRGRERPI